MNAQRFRFGLNIGTWDSRERLVELVGRADADGYDVVVGPDHISERPAILPTLAAVAEMSPRIRVSPLVIANDYRNPVVLAKDCATIDILSGGRFELGIGTGWIEDQYRAAGISYDSPGARVGRFEEAVAVIKGCWSGEPFTFTGDHYQVSNASCPKPVQSPRPPLLIAGAGPRLLGIAGREADIINLSPAPKGSRGFTAIKQGVARTGDLLDAQLEWIRAGAGERAGQIEMSVSISRLVITNGPDDAVAAAAADTDATSNQIRTSPHMLIGSQGEIVETLLERRDRYGISYIIFGVHQLEDAQPIVARLAGS